MPAVKITNIFCMYVELYLINLFRFDLGYTFQPLNCAVAAVCSGLY